MWGLFVSARYQDFWNEEIVLRFSIAAPIIWFYIFHMTGRPALCAVAGLGEAFSPNSQGTIALCATTVQNEGKKNSVVHKYKMLWNSPFNLNLAISCSLSRPGCSGLQWVTFSAAGRAGGQQRRARHIVYWLVSFLKAVWEPTSSMGVPAQHAGVKHPYMGAFCQFKRLSSSRAVSWWNLFEGISACFYICV